MIFKNLTFDGISLKEYGVYISGEAVFDSPTREVEMITIPGRNGSFALDKGRFNNITVTYPAGIYATNETEFAEKVSTLRNLLASRKGYCRLTDEYNPDEFRLGVYKAGLELDPTHYNEAGRFELSFDCKPQRFLFSGEEVFTLGEWGQTETHSGSIVSFEGDETTAIKSLTAQIVPKQSGSGDPSPSNVRPISGWDAVNVTRCGKNIIPKMTAGTYSANGGTIVVDSNGVATLSGTTTASGNVAIIPLESSVTITQEMVDKGLYYHLRNSAVIANLEPTLENNSAVRATGYAFSPANRISPQLGGGVVGKTVTRIRFYVASGVTLSGTYAPSLEFTNEATDYEPYNGTSYPISLGQTVYGGTLDVVSGVLTSFPYYSSYNGQTLSGRWICDRAVYSQGTTPPTGSQVVDMSGNGTEVTLTPTEVQTLLGQNNIWADSGDVTVEIGQNPYILVNPTLFEACPLIEFNASGSGEINLGSKKLEFFNSPLGTINLPFTVSTSENTTDTTDTIEFSGSYNAGDKFRVKGSKASFNLTASSTISSVEFPGGMDLRVNAYESSKNGSNAITTVEDWQETEFTIGTASTVNKTYTPSYVFGGSSHTATFTLSLVYDGDATLLMVWTATLPSGMTLNRITTNSKYTLVCDSTANSLTGDLYIDLDIGEAYKAEDDSITSINNFVNLGGELPTLDPGATEISTDSSISNVKVTPRWWKV